MSTAPKQLASILFIAFFLFCGVITSDAIMDWAESDYKARADQTDQKVDEMLDIYYYAGYVDGMLNKPPVRTRAFKPEVKKAIERLREIRKEEKDILYNHRSPDIKTPEIGNHARRTSPNST